MGVAGIERHAAVAATLVSLAAMSLEQRSIDFHHPVVTLGIRAQVIRYFGLAAARSHVFAVSRKLANRPSGYGSA